MLIAPPSTVGGLDIAQRGEVPIATVTAWSRVGKPDTPNGWAAVRPEGVS